jgi:hypothetical protein
MSFRVLTGQIFYYMDSAPLYNEVYGEQLIPFGNSDINISSGLVLNRNQYFSAKMNSYINNIFVSNMSFGFSLISKNIGVLEGSTSSNIKNIIFPIIDLSSYTKDEYTGITAIDSSIFLVQEKLLLDNKNQLEIFLYGSSGFVKITSSAYDANKKNYFWIAYNGSTIKIFINAEEDTSATISGSIPSSLKSLSNSYFSINRNIVGENIVKNSGTIDDIVVLNEYEIDTEILERIILVDARWAFDDTGPSTQEEINFPIMTDDPKTIKITDFDSNGVHYVASNDNGEIIEGENIIWDKVIDFTNITDLSKYNIEVLNSENIEINNGLIIKNGVIEIR